MALFVVQVQARLHLSEQDKARFERIAVALETLVAKITEPMAEVPPELHDEIVETATAATALQHEQAQQGV